MGSQNNSGMFANLIIRTNVADATQVLCCLKKNSFLVKRKLAERSIHISAITVT